MTRATSNREQSLRQRRLSGVDQALMARWQREADAQPGASLARKMYELRDKPLLADSKRQHVSPLDGRAVEGKGRGRR